MVVEKVVGHSTIFDRVGVLDHQKVLLELGIATSDSWVWVVQHTWLEWNENKKGIRRWNTEQGRMHTGGSFWNKNSGKDNGRMLYNYFIVSSLTWYDRTQKKTMNENVITKMASQNFSRIYFSKWWGVSILVIWWRE